MIPMPIRRKSQPPSTKQILQQLDELVNEFKTTLQKLRELYEEEDEDFFPDKSENN